MQPNQQDSVQSFFRLVRSPFKFRLFLLGKLPAAFIAGVRIRSIDEGKCVTSVPYKWLTRNPFRSTYFACLSMAAEMSTGALALAHLHKRKPSIALLVVKVEGEFLKKAVGKTYFTCDEGMRIRDAIDETAATGESRSVRALSIGRNKEGEKVAEFYVTWSFKRRN